MSQGRGNFPEPFFVGNFNKPVNKLSSPSLNFFNTGGLVAIYCKEGFQIGLQYSRCGRTRDLYKSIKVLLSRHLKEWLIRARLLLAALIFDSIWDLILSHVLQACREFRPRSGIFDIIYRMIKFDIFLPFLFLLS